MAGGAADRTAVGFHGHRLQSAAAEDAPVGAVHGGIGLAQRGFVGVEGVGVLHDEFAPPHQTEAGADLIAELGLNLIKIHRQLPVGTQQVCRQGRDHLLVGGAEAQFPALAILQVKHDAFAGRVAGPAATPLPEIGWLQLRQQGFQGACLIHLLPHNGGDLL